MKRITVIAMMLLLVGSFAVGSSHAQEITTIKGSCFALPDYIPTPCPATPLPVAPGVNVEKTMSVSGGLTEPLGFTEFLIHIVSRAACFSLNEPINVFTFGNPGAAALRPATPGTIAISNPNAFTATFDQSGDAYLSLEVRRSDLGPGGLLVKAVWPLEGVEQIATIYEPSPATATPQGTPPPAASPTPASTPTNTPVAGTAVAMSVAAQPTSQPFSVSVCETPNPVPIGGAGTVYVRTTPGATCTPSILFSNGDTVPDLGPFIVGTTGIASIPFTAADADLGLATVSCTLGSQTDSDRVFFNINRGTT
jgi:hypothetical protein